MKDIRLGRFRGMDVSMAPSAQAFSLLLFAIAFGATYFWLRFSLQSAVVGSLLVVALHWVAEVLHNYGHFLAARKSGHPMTGVQLYYAIGKSLYPSDEGQLPPAVHVQRALGGPKLSAVVGIVATVIAVVAYFVNLRLRWVAYVFAADNVFVFALGAFLPLGFTDGSTLLRNVGKS